MTTAQAITKLKSLTFRNVGKNALRRSCAFLVMSSGLKISMVKSQEATGFLNDKGIGSHEVEDIPASTTSANLLFPDDLQKEEDEDVITFNLVSENEPILHPKGDDNRKSYCSYNDLEVEADVCTSQEPDPIDQGSQPTSEVQEDYLMTGSHSI